MLRLTSYITIGAYVFDYMVETQITSSYDQFTDKATIILPDKFRDINKPVANNNGVFKRGDTVTIELGYYPSRMVIFSGYVSKIIPGSPIRIECEDAGWLLKQQNIKNFYQKSCTLTQLLAHLMGGTGIQYKNIEVNIGTYKISNKDYVNIIDCLDQLKQNFGLFSWFRDGVLHVGYPNTQQFYTTNEVEFSFENDIITSNLEYTVTNQTDVVLQGISNKLDNSKITRYCFYDANGNIILSDEAGQGEQRTFNYIELSKADLDSHLTAQLPNMVYDGYKGGFETFGQPVIFALDKIKLKNIKYPEREGIYLVKAVNTSFNGGGYRQNIDLDLKLG